MNFIIWILLAFTKNCISKFPPYFNNKSTLKVVKRVSELPCLNYILRGNSKKEDYILKIDSLTHKILNIIIYPKKQKFFELPKEDVFPYHKNKCKEHNTTQFEYSIIIKDNPISLSIVRKSTNEEIFSIHQLFIAPGTTFYFNASVPNENTFGIGQRTSSFKIPSGIYELYNKDTPLVIDFGWNPNQKGEKRRSGSHPVFLQRENSGNYYIGYLRNGFPLEIEFSQSEKTIEFSSVLGGLVDFTIFLGDKNPEGVVKDYHEYLGKWAIPPFWSLGFHQSRWGYANLTVLVDKMERFQRNHIPIDAFWLDIDHMNSSQSYTWNTKNFKPHLFRALYKYYKKRYVLLTEPSISLHSNFLIKKGVLLNIFIRTPSNKKYLINKAWGGPSFFIDYFNPNSTKFISDCNDYIYNISNFSGIWIDMNEIATFSDGMITANEESIPCFLNLSESFSFDPLSYYYNSMIGKVAEHKSICSKAKHYKGFNNYEIHNFYSSKSVKVHYDYLEKKFPDEFPFVLSRASAPGLGKYGFLWSGDNGSNHTWYKYSLSEVILFGFFGVAMSGTDICGFSGETNEVLCSRWYQLGALFPFFRNHRHHDDYDNDVFSMGPTLLETAKISIKFRYSILKYYYYQFIKQKRVGLVLKPLFFVYNDEEVFSNYVIDSQFLLGDDLLCIPNMNYNNSSKVTAFFPRGYKWYDLRNYSYFNTEDKGFVEVDVKLNNTLGIFIVEGKMIFMNKVNEEVMSTNDLPNIFTLVFAHTQMLEGYYQSEGYIPSIMNYNSKKEIENYVEHNCLIKFNSLFSPKVSMLSIKIENSGKKNGSFIEISDIKAMFPFDISKYEISEVIYQSKAILNFKIEYIGKNSFVLIPEGNLKIEQGDTQLNIFFRINPR